MKFATRSTNAKVNEHQSNQTKRVEDEVQLKPKRQPYFLPLPWSQVTGHRSQFTVQPNTTDNSELHMLDDQVETEEEKRCWTEVRAQSGHHGSGKVPAGQVVLST